jgi:hypothetical protein
MTLPLEFREAAYQKTVSIAKFSLYFIAPDYKPISYFGQ